MLLTLLVLGAVCPSPGVEPAFPTTLGGAIDHPGDEGRQLAEVATSHDHCKTPKPPKGKEDKGCSDAQLTMMPDGTLRWNASAAASTLCFLRQRVGDWQQAEVKVRGTDQRESDSLCFLIEADVTYQLRKDVERPLMKVWAPRPEKSLAAEGKKALTAARATYASQVRAWAFRWAAWRLRQDDAQSAGAVTDALAAKLRDATGGLETDAGVRAASVDTAREAVFAASQAIYDHWPSERRFVCEFAAADPRLAVGSSTPLIQLAAAEKPDEIAATELIALAHQPPTQQSIPWPLFLGELPSSEPVIDVPAAGGERSDSQQIYEGERVSFFVHDLEPEHKISGVSKGAKIVRPVSDIALALGAAVVALQQGGLESPLLAMAPPDCKAVLEELNAQDPVTLRSVKARKRRTQLRPLLTKADACQLNATEAKLKKELEELVASKCPDPLPTEPDPPLTPTYRQAWWVYQQVAASPACEHLDLLLEQYEEKLRNQEWATGAADASTVRTSRVVNSSEVEVDHHYSLRVCRADTCDAETPPAKVTADVSIETRAPHAIVSMGTEVAGNVPLNPAEQVPLGGYRFNEVGGATGIERLFSLQGRSDAASAFTFSALVLVYPFARVRNPNVQGIVFGAGPTVFSGDDVQFLKQWNLRAGYELPFARGVVIGFGFGVRAVEVPTRLPVGALVSVPQTGAPPAFDTSTRFMWVFSFGLTIDLKVLGEAAKLVGGAFKGGGGSAESKEEKK